MNIKSCRRCLVIAAHADDETLGAGGLIKRLSQGNCEVAVAIATDSTSAQYGDDEDAKERRNSQFNAAIDRLGITKTFKGSFPDMRLDRVAHIEINQWLEKIVADFRPNWLLVHSPSDVNRDHVCLFDSAMVASRPAPGQSIDLMMSYYVGSATEWGQFSSPRFEPSVFVNITETLDTKLAAMQCYEDEKRQFPHPRSLRALEAQARHFGAIVGVEAAEPYQLHRAILS